MMKYHEQSQVFGSDEPITIDTLLESDPLFVELARTLVQQNYYETVFLRTKGSLREMREDYELTPMLLFVNTDGIQEKINSDQNAFRPIAVSDLGDLLIREANPNGFVDDLGKYQDPSDGGYFIRRDNDGKLLISREKEIFNRFESAVAIHNEIYPEIPIDEFKNLLDHYLPADFSSYTSRSFKVGGRTQGALAAALGGDENTKSYIVKQTVYDGVTGKLARFGKDGIEMEFFLYKLPPEDERAEWIESYHPAHKIMGVLRIYDDVLTRREYAIGPSDLGLDVPEPAHKISLTKDDVLQEIGKGKK